MLQASHGLPRNIIKRVQCVRYSSLLRVAVPPPFWRIFSDDFTQPIIPDSHRCKCGVKMKHVKKKRPKQQQFTPPSTHLTGSSNSFFSGWWLCFFELHLLISQFFFSVIESLLELDVIGFMTPAVQTRMETLQPRFSWKSGLRGWVNYRLR